MLRYDALLLLSFGGPEHPDDVMPFLRNVTRGRGIPPERLAEVAEHYQHFGGVSPINSQCRQLIAAIEADFRGYGLDLPIYWGNRNWKPMIANTVIQMRDDGIKRALALATSAYGGYSSCRQYLEDIANARAAVGPDAPVIDKLRQFNDHPGFIEPHTDAVRAALVQLDPARRADTRLVFTAHSIPESMAVTAGLNSRRYQAQLNEVAALVAAAAAPDLPYELVWQSRSGPPQVPWLEPDINDYLEQMAAAGATAVVVSPIGFISDHLEVLWDLDNEAAATAARVGLAFARAATPGVDPRFVRMVRDLVLERLTDPPAAPAGLGTVPRWHTCAIECCPAPPRRR